METPQKKIENTEDRSWNPFEPITIEIKKIEIPDNFESMCRNWVVNNGEYEDQNKFYTSFPVSSQIPDFAEPIINKLVLPGTILSEAWIQTYKPGGFHGPHNHYGGENVLAGCLYLSSGDSSIFQNPLLPNEHESTPVECGTVLYWHPALFHCSAPSDKTRTILAFNLIYDNRGILGDEENYHMDNVDSYEDPYKDEYET